MTSLFFILLPMSLQAADEPRPRAVDAAASAIVSEIDPTLPPVTLEAWLHSTSDSEAQIRWDLSDCGEQTGNPDLDRGRDFPMCVEGRVSMSGDRTLMVSLVVGTWRTGVGGTPAFREAYLQTGDGPPRFFPTLGQIGAAASAP